MDLYKDFENYLSQDKTRLDIPITISLVTMEYKNGNITNGEGSTNKIILEIAQEDGGTGRMRVDNYDEVYEFINRTVKEIITKKLTV